MISGVKWFDPKTLSPGRININGNSPALDTVSMILYAYRLIHPKSRAGAHFHEVRSRGPRMRCTYCRKRIPAASASSHGLACAHAWARREFPPVAAETLITLDEDVALDEATRNNILQAALDERARWKAGTP